LQRFLDPSVLAGISGLDLIAKYRMAPTLANGQPIANGIVRQGLSWSLH